MKYYSVMLSGEYSKRKGKFGIVKPTKSVNRFLFKDGKAFPFKEYEGLELVWYEDQDATKVLADYQMTLLFGRAISNKLKVILEKYATNDMVYFHPIPLTDKNDQNVEYYLLHFNKILDVIDTKNSYLTSLLPKVLADKLVGINVFNIDEGLGKSFCVSEIVKDEMEAMDITGCAFELIS